MKKFEYTRFWLLSLPPNGIVEAKQTMNELQKLGENGWEVCIKLREQGTSQLLLLKREIL